MATGTGLDPTRSLSVLHCRRFPEGVFVRKVYSSVLRTAVFLAILFAFLPVTAQGQSTLSPELRQQIDHAATDVLTATGVPGASVAIVKDGQICYLQAYGNGRLDPATAARPEMRYSIGSISKQFTATAILLLQEQGKLSLDDKVAKFIPNLTRANEVSIRQLLSHTSG